MDLEGIKDISKALFFAVDVQPDLDVPLIISHPFTNSIVLADENGLYNILEEGGYERFKTQIFTRINKAKDIVAILTLVNKPYRMTLLKYWKSYLTSKEFSELFAEQWVMSENPNQDANCSLKECVLWFKEAKKEWLMDTKELRVYNNLPEELDVYRGVAVGRTSYGLSWTANLEVATWFAGRYNHGNRVGYVQKAHIKKENILAYFASRNEEEIVVDVDKIRKQIERLDIVPEKKARN